MSANHFATHHITKVYANVPREPQASQAMQTPEVPQNTLDRSLSELSSGSLMLPSNSHSYANYRLANAEFSVSTLAFYKLEKNQF
jgi:hypothetical protein